MRDANRSVIPLSLSIIAASMLVAAASTEAFEPWEFEIVDGAGAPTAARVVVFNPERGEFLAPEGAVVWSMVQQPGRYNRADYFYTDGRFVVDTDAAALEIYVRKGLEYEIVEMTLERANAPSTIVIRRVIDMNAKGYYSGDGHIHPVSGRPGWVRIPNRVSFHDESAITNDLLRMISEAEDLDLANLLSSNSTGDEVHFAHRVTGHDEPESDHEHVLRVSEEFRSEVYGHMSIFGITRPGDPVFSGLPGSKLYPFDYPTNHEICLKYVKEGAYPSFAHLRRQGNIALEAPVDVALGSLDAIEIQGYAVAPRTAVVLWEHLMNCGFDVVITAGTDSTLTFVNNLPVGGARSYVELGDQEFSHDAWVARLAEGRSFTTNGAMLFFTADGKKPGESITLERGESRTVDIEIEVESLFEWDAVNIRMNGEQVLSFESDPDAGVGQRFSGSIELDGPAWIYAHLVGPENPAHAHAPMNPWWKPTHDAFTNAVWVRSPGESRLSTGSAEFLIDWIQSNLAALERRDNYGSDQNRTEVRETFQSAIEVLDGRKVAP